MIEFSGRVLLLDIEGTTSSIDFVHETLMPFAADNVEPYLRSNWHLDETQAAISQIARDAGHPIRESFFASVTDAGEQIEVVLKVFDRLMAIDSKATGLKQLQGILWRSGYESGELRSHVYPEVPATLRAWSRKGRDIRIYSSGSIEAQKLFFSHSVAGDLSKCFRDHYDTTIGPKRATASYVAIADLVGCKPAEILFVSDVVEELDAAYSAGLATALSVRPGNAPVKDGHRHAAIGRLDEIAWR